MKIKVEGSVKMGTSYAGLCIKLCAVPITVGQKDPRQAFFSTSSHLTTHICIEKSTIVYYLSKNHAIDPSYLPDPQTPPNDLQLSFSLGHPPLNQIKSPIPHSL
jgi:hypothetical protein